MGPIPPPDNHPTRAAGHLVPEHLIESREERSGLRPRPRHAGNDVQRNTFSAANRDPECCCPRHQCVISGASSARCASIKVSRPDIGAPVMGNAERELPVPPSISRVGHRARTGMPSAILAPSRTCTFATMRANRPGVRLSDIRPDRSRVDPAEKRVRIRRDRCAKLGTFLLLRDP